MNSSPSLQQNPYIGDWLEFDTDTVIVHSGKVEIGQHVGNALQVIAADTLDLGLARIEIAAVTTSNSPDEGYTAGSNSVEHSGAAVRLACLATLSLLHERASTALNSNEDIRYAAGVFSAAQGAHEVSLWELSDAELLATRIDAVLTSDERAADASSIASRSASDWHTGRDDGASEGSYSANSLAALMRGERRFLHDLQVSDMWHARVLRPPHYHARLKHTAAIAQFEAHLATPVQASSTRADIPVDIRVVVNGSFVAVAGGDEWQVLSAAKRLATQLEWSEHQPLAGEDIHVSLTNAPRQSFAVIDGVPTTQPAAPPPSPSRQPSNVSLSARYDRPYQMHGSIGPSAALAQFVDGKLSVISHTQGVFPLRGALAEALNLEPAQVEVRHHIGSGCYGHNGADDVALDAALVAQALPGQAVLLKWTREDEHAWEPYAPAMAVQLRAELSSTGDVLLWQHDAYSDTHVQRPRAGLGEGGSARLIAAQHIANPSIPAPAKPNMSRHAGIHRNADPLYAFSERRISKHLVKNLPLRTSAMRTLGAFANVFAIESFMNEAAYAIQHSPVEFRLRHLKDVRARVVLERAVRRMARYRGNQPAEPIGNASQGYGLAIAQYKNAQAYCAVAVQLQVDAGAEVQLQHAVLVADAGRVIDASGLRSQLEGGFIQAASWTLLESVEYDAGGITSRDWDSYPILKFTQIPTIDVELVDQPEQPSLGAGEASSGPAGAAIANAIFDAVGVRARRMPFTPRNLRQAALDS